MTPIAKVWIEDSFCAANEACLLLETHVFIRKAGDYVPAIAEDAAQYFESHRRQIIESVLSCPVSAIHLQFTDGRVITSDDYEPLKSIEEWVNY